MRRAILAVCCGMFVMVYTVQAQADTAQVVLSGRVNDAAQEQKPYVIFISADGFRHDLADKYKAANLLAFRARGVAASAMTPSFPSLTFPNHYSLATGLYPSHHGIVDNTFFDAALGNYRIGYNVAVLNPAFYGGVPIWVLAEQQKMLSASFFWVGSEAPIDGVLPSYYYHFNDKIALDTRLRAVKDWLSLPEAQRPHLILFYLSPVDHAEHYHGVDAKETEDAVHVVDDCIGRMVRMVDSLHLPVNYVFVSDHGMANVDTARPIVPPVVDTSKFTVAAGGTMIHLYAKDASVVRSTYERLKKEAEGYDVLLPDETPGYWHYRKADDRYHRMGDIILVGHVPRVFHDRGHMLLGDHGYDNALPDMGATFYAWGPAFKEGQTIPAFENVDVYPMIAQILGLKISEPVDGKPGTLKSILK